MGVASSKYGPMICMPTGRPLLVRPIGATVAGSPVRVAKKIHGKKSLYGRLPPGVGTERASQGVRSCGGAAQKIVGSRNASWVRKYSCHAARAAIRAAFHSR